MSAGDGQEYKVVFLGDAAVGKTSIILRYINNYFNLDNKSTITASFFTKTAFTNNTQIRLQIWDTAGQERFQSVAPMYYRNADIIFVVCSNDSPQSVEKAKYWLEKVRENSIKYNVIISVLVNKADLPCQFNEYQLYQLKDDFGVRSYSVSARTGENVIGAIQQTIDQIRMSGEAERKNYIDVNGQGQSGGNGRCC